MTFCQSCGQALLVIDEETDPKRSESVGRGRIPMRMQLSWLRQCIGPRSFLAQGTVEAHISQNSWQWALILMTGFLPKKCVWSGVNHIQGWTLETFHETCSPLLNFCSDTERCKSKIEEPWSLSHCMEDNWPGGVSKHHWILYNRDTIFLSCLLAKISVVASSMAYFN